MLGCGKRYRRPTVNNYFCSVSVLLYKVEQQVHIVEFDRQRQGVELAHIAATDDGILISGVNDALRDDERHT